MQYGKPAIDRLISRDLTGLLYRDLSGRREVLKSLFKLTAGSAAASIFPDPNVFSAPLAPRQEAQNTNHDSEMVHYSSGAFDIQAYIAKPSGAENNPAIILVHDNWGLNEHVKEMARQFAAAGFLTMAPDLLSRSGGTAKLNSPEAAGAALGRIPPSATVNDLNAGYDFFRKYSGVNAARISSVGYGWGGWRSFMLATIQPALFRSVMFCGSTPISGLENIHAPVLAHYAQYDFRTTGNALPTRNEMTSLRKKFIYHVYPNVSHSFYDDTTPQYNGPAAQQAWQRTLDFLKS